MKSHRRSYLHFCITKNLLSWMAIYRRHAKRRIPATTSARTNGCRESVIWESIPKNWSYVCNVCKTKRDCIDTCDTHWQPLVGMRPIRQDSSEFFVCSRDTTWVVSRTVLLAHAWEEVHKVDTVFGTVSQAVQQPGSNRLLRTVRRWTARTLWKRTWGLTTAWWSIVARQEVHGSKRA